MTYTQCKLGHLSGRFQTAWIPSQLAKLHKSIQLMGENDWIVMWVGQTKMDEDFADQLQQSNHHLKGRL